MLISLYDSQKEAISKMKNGCLLWADVGTGKSRTSLAYYASHVCGNNIYKDDGVRPKYETKLYIITTATKRNKHEWDGELLPFDIHPEDVVVDSWNNIEKYIKVKQAFFIFDEQRVVGYGKWSKSFIKISQQNQWILLTATPGDSWMEYIPVFIANGFYKNKTEFVNRHVIYDYRTTYPKVRGYYDEGQLIAYRRQILVYMKLEKQTISHKEVIKVPFDKVAYRRVFADRWDIYKDEPIENISRLCYTMRKVINSDPSRIAEVEILCQKHPKIIIFYNFDYELDILKNGKYVDGTVIAEWNGHKHEPIPKSSRWIYLVQYTAGAEGWNCIETDTIIFYSQNYSYKVMIQAAGRIDRANTPFIDLYFYTLKSSSSIDTGISRALKAKKNFNESSFFVR